MNIVTDELGATVPPLHIKELESHFTHIPGDWRFLYANVAFGRYTLYSEDDKTITKIEAEVDIAPIFDYNAEMMSASNGQRFGDGKMIAKIPTTLMHGDALKGLGTALNEGDTKYASKILNDSDYSKLRTFRGNI